MHQNRTLIRGDNLTEMREFPDEYVDLIATDSTVQLQTRLFCAIPRRTWKRTRYPCKGIYGHMDMGQRCRRSM